MGILLINEEAVITDALKRVWFRLNFRETNEITNVLLKNISAHLIGLNVLLENGKQYEIVHIPLHDVTHPIHFDGLDIIDTSKLNTKIKKVV